MKIQVMRLGETSKGEDHIVPEFETPDGWHVLLTDSNGVTIMVQEAADGGFAIHARDAHTIAIEPEASNIVVLRGKQIGIDD